MVIPKVIYVDNFKGTINFFKNMDLIISLFVTNTSNFRRDLSIGVFS
jgi:hypothetical protein